MEGEEGRDRTPGGMGAGSRCQRRSHSLLPWEPGRHGPGLGRFRIAGPRNGAPGFLGRLGRGGGAAGGEGSSQVIAAAGSLRAAATAVMPCCSLHRRQRAGEAHGRNRKDRKHDA